MPLHDELVETRIAELKSRVATGDVREGTIRALLYVGIPRATVDARGFEAIRRLRAVRYDVQRPTLAEFKSDGARASASSCCSTRRRPSQRFQLSFPMPSRGAALWPLCARCWAPAARSPAKWPSGCNGSRGSSA